MLIHQCSASVDGLSKWIIAEGNGSQRTVILHGPLGPDNQYMGLSGAMSIECFEIIKSNGWGCALPTISEWDDGPGELGDGANMYNLAQYVHSTGSLFNLEWATIPGFREAYAACSPECIGNTY